MNKSLKRFIVIAIIFAIIFTLGFFADKHTNKNNTTNETSIIPFVFYWFTMTTLCFICYNAFANYNEKRYKIAEENRKLRQAQLIMANKILQENQEETKPNEHHRRNI